MVGVGVDCVSPQSTYGSPGPGSPTVERTSSSPVPSRTVETLGSRPACGRAENGRGEDIEGFRGPTQSSRPNVWTEMVTVVSTVRDELWKLLRNNGS